MTFFSSSEKLEIGGVPFVSHNAKPTRSEAIEYYRRVTMKFDLNVGLYETIKGIEKTDTGFELTSSKEVCHCKKVILASGFYDHVNKLNIPGEDLAKVKHYYLDPHPYFKQKLAIVGAMNSAVDAALECWRKGAESVTMLIREPEIPERVKYWVRPDIVNRIQEGSIKAHFNAELIEIKESSLKFKSADRVEEIENDFVLAPTGYKPDFDFMKNIGIQLDENNSMIPSYNPDSMESNVPGLYLAGVVCGDLETRKWFIENSRVHADIIMVDIAKKMKARLIS
jgi:thioredoxin reductase (NADPH)